jgi:hypothetical protein
MICISCSYTLVREKADNGKWYWLRYYKNTEKREKWYAKKAFRYAKDSTYERYKGKITSDTDCEHDVYIRFDSVQVILDSNSLIYKDLFLSGTLFPQAIYCVTSNCDATSLTKIDLQTHKVIPEQWCGWVGHTMFVEEIKEANYFKKDFKKKRFELRFILPSINPDIIFFEITDSSANKHTPLDKFIKEGKLTVLVNGWGEI